MKLKSFYAVPKGMTLKRLFVFAFYSLIFINASLASEPSKKALYIEQYTSVAVEQMNLYGIPASITLAQGMLESGYGESALAKSSNNHFGIKCHADWTGAKTYANDDKPNECFRVYNTVNESYEDHSKFLVNNKRYASLFLLDPKDYKGWAEGLKAAGYATSPTYATLLISLIEESSLQDLDVRASVAVSSPVATSIFQVKIHENKVRYITAEKGDTYYKISKRTGITLRQLHRYNEHFSKKDLLKKGEKVYLDPRRSRAKHKKNITLKKATTARALAQEEALKLKPLLRRNNIASADEILPKGTELRLR